MLRKVIEIDRKWRNCYSKIDAVSSSRKFPSRIGDVSNRSHPSPLLIIRFPLLRVGCVENSILGCDPRVRLPEIHSRCSHPTKKRRENRRFKYAPSRRRFILRGRSLREICRLQLMQISSTMTSAWISSGSSPDLNF